VLLPEETVPSDSGSPASAGLSDVVEAALAGLTASPKTLPPKLFYDDEGCRLFYEITRLPEYYLTRTEKYLLGDLAHNLVPEEVSGAALVEFGGSDEEKARYLLDLRNSKGQPVFQTYVSIDVAASALTLMQTRLRSSHPYLRVVPIVADFMQPLRLPDIGRRRFGFFPGSTIGNLDPNAAIRFLRAAHASLGTGSWFLLGADLRKDPALLLPAYNDSAGVTAAFNLNLLRRLNREAQADFDLESFRHQAIWNDAESRIEMYLFSRRDQVVSVGGHRITFQRDEPIHTENSYKHRPETLIGLARDAGWISERIWTDPAELFGVFLFRRG
jgi:dimethylhistidine N-methyltransferase